MYIDPHVHCRDEEEKEKETIAHALKVAEDSGVDAIFDIGNLKNNPVTTRQRVLDRFELAFAANSSVKYFTYVILTKDKEQIKEAVETWREFFPATSNHKVGVIGLKMFAGQSTGDCGIVTLEDQLEVDECLVKEEFDGVKAVHCEDETLIFKDLWDSRNPISHCDARPLEAERLSILKQIENYSKVKARYHLEVKHVTTKQSVDLISFEKSKMRISSEVCARNLLLDNQVMLGDKGIQYKVNPPLREEKFRGRLFECFLRGEIDTLATDHSPHTYEDKTVRHLSGMPGLASWPDFIDMLFERGAGQELIYDMAFNKINKIYGLNIQRLNLPVKKGLHLAEYVIDPFVSLKN